VLVRALHLCALSAFAVAQPLFDLLGDTPEFFVVRGSTTLDIVAFALGVLLVPPLVLFALETLGGLLHPKLGEALHLLFVGALVGLIALQALKRLADLSTATSFVLAVALGAAVAALYAWRPSLRTFATVLAPAPVVFLTLFLLDSPLDKLSLESEAQANELIEVRSQTPVVVLVLDELPTVSLMDERRRIDPERFPNFAALAADSTWFRNATTVHEHTTEAVPAILTGREPEHGRLPLLSDHPDNLFTFLGGSYRMHVFEPVTQLCPSDLCPRHRDSFPARMSALGQDVGVVYGHVVLPDGLTRRLPSVTETWQNFGKAHAEDQFAAKPLAVRNAEDIDRAVGRQLWSDVRFQFERYVDSIEPSPRPTLFFLHALLPHSPWRFLPSGRQYGDSLGIDGLANDRWGKDEWLVEQGWQRHLLQAAFVDRLLGELTHRLKETGLYDRSLIVVVADHGVSFRPGDRRRGITPSNIGDIAPVPLLVKRPNQNESAAVDRAVTTIDILPTIAEVLGQDLPFETDGRSLFDSQNDRDEILILQRVGESVGAEASSVFRGRDESAARMNALFASGLYAFGPHRNLVGREAALVPREEAEEPTASIDGETLLNAVDPQSAIAPSHVTGSLAGDGAQTGSWLAISVNGRIAGVTRTYGPEDEVKFSAFLPETAFRAGENDVEVFAVVGTGKALVLDRLGGTGEGASYKLEADTIETAEGSVSIAPGALEGRLEDWYFERDAVRFGGWAGDVEAGEPAEKVLVFADGELLHSGTPSVGREDLGKRYPGLGRSGFVFDLPSRVVGEGGDVSLRFFALRGGQATELSYAPDFPWRDTS
jgi:hypothetical protein